MLARWFGDEVALTHATHRLGRAALFGGDMPTGVALMEEALARFRALGEVDSIATHVCDARCASPCR